MHSVRCTATLAAAFLVLLLGPMALASATGPEQIVQGRYLTLISQMSEGAENLSPGEGVQWTVGVSARDVAEGTISRDLTVGGALADHVRVSVDSCSSHPSGTGCGERTTLLEGVTPSAGSTIDLGTQDATAQRWLVVSVTLDEAAPDTAQSLTGSLRLHARGAGEELETTPPGDDGEDDGEDDGGGDDGGGDDGTGDGSSGGDGSGSEGDSSGEGSAGGDGSGEDSSATGGLPGFLAATGIELLLGVLAALGLLLLGARLLRRRSPR